MDKSVEICWKEEPKKQVGKINEKGAMLKRSHLIIRAFSPSNLTLQKQNSVQYVIGLRRAS